MYLNRSWFNSNLALVFFFTAETLAVLATFAYVIYTYANWSAGGQFAGWPKVARVYEYYREQFTGLSNKNSQG